MSNILLSQSGVVSLTAFNKPLNEQEETGPAHCLIDVGKVFIDLDVSKGNPSEYNFEYKMVNVGVQKDITSFTRPYC